MKIWSLIGIVCCGLAVSFYAVSIAGYVPKFSRYEQRIIDGLKQRLETLLIGAQNVLELKEVKTRLEAQTQEHNAVIKRAADRKVFAPNRRGSVGGGRNGGYGQPRRGHGGGGGNYGRNPYSSGYSYGRGGSGYPGDGNSSYPYDNSPFKPHADGPNNKPPADKDNNNGPGGRVLNDADKKKIPATTADINTALALAEEINQAMAAVPAHDPIAQETAIENLSENGTFAQLQDAVAKRAAQRAEEAATLQAASANQANTNVVSTAKPIPSSTAQLLELDRKLLAAYRSILPHVMFAATKDTPDSAAQELLKGDMQQLGKPALQAEAKKHIPKVLSAWQNTVPDYTDDKTVAQDPTTTNYLQSDGTGAIPTAVPGVTRAIIAPPAGLQAATAAANAEATAANKPAAFKAAYRSYFQAHLNDLKARKHRFAGFGVTDFGNLDAEINECKKILRTLN
jgi:hypothetical protein